MNEFTPTRQHDGLMGDAEAAGFRNAILAGLDVLAPLYAARTEVGMKFDREKEGLGAAHRCVVAGETDRKFLHTEEECPNENQSVMRL